MKRRLPAKGASSPEAIAALSALLTGARTLDHFTPESLARSYSVPRDRAERMLDDARRKRVAS